MPGESSVPENRLCPRKSSIGIEVFSQLVRVTNKRRHVAFLIDPKLRSPIDPIRDVLPQLAARNISDFLGEFLVDVLHQTRLKISAPLPANLGHLLVAYQQFPTESN